MLSRPKFALLLASLIILTGVTPAYAENKEYSKEEVSTWIADASTEIMNFSFYGYEKKKEENKKFFIQKGHKSFYNSLFLKFLSETISKNQQLVKSKISCMPEIKLQPPSKNTDKKPHAKWLATFPLEMEFYTPANTKTMTTNVQALITSQEDEQGKSSLKIIKWTATQSSEKDAYKCSEIGLKKAQIKTHKDKVRSLHKTILTLEKRVKELRQQKETSEKKEISIWLNHAVLDIFKFRAKDFDERKKQNKQYFTQRGFKSFYKAMERARIREMIEKNNQTVSASMRCMPEIELAPPRSKDESPSTKWKATFHKEIQYSSPNGTEETTLLVTAIITKRKDNKLGIEQWIAVPRHERRASVCSEAERKENDIKAYKDQIIERQKSIDTLEKEVEGLEK